MVFGQATTWKRELASTAPAMAFESSVWSAPLIELQVALDEFGRLVRRYAPVDEGSFLEPRANLAQKLQAQAHSEVRNLMFSLFAVPSFFVSYLWSKTSH